MMHLDVHLKNHMCFNKALMKLVSKLVTGMFMSEK